METNLEEEKKVFYFHRLSEMHLENYSNVLHAMA